MIAVPIITWAEAMSRRYGGGIGDLGQSSGAGCEAESTLQRAEGLNSMPMKVIDVAKIRAARRG